MHPSGQDDNLGDSALRAGLLGALRVPGAQLHVLLEGQSSDYLAGLPLIHTDRRYSTRNEWSARLRGCDRPVYVVNAGEVNPGAGTRFPRPDVAAEMRMVVAHGGSIVAAGLGLKDPAGAREVVFDEVLRRMDVLSWRDQVSADEVAIGEVAPDWGFRLGTASAAWRDTGARRLLAVTLRFDRPRPDGAWLGAVRAIAGELGTSIVTVAQVARDAPTAVWLAERLGGRYLQAPRTDHATLDRHVRAVYAESIAVISDRAHALILGATEGAVPVGSAQDPEKVRRILETAGLGELTGTHATFSERASADGIVRMRTRLPAALHEARVRLDDLEDRVGRVIGNP